MAKGLHIWAYKVLNVLKKLIHNTKSYKSRNFKNTYVPLLFLTFAHSVSFPNGPLSILHDQPRVCGACGHRTCPRRRYWHIRSIEQTNHELPRASPALPQYRYHRGMKKATNSAESQTVRKKRHGKFNSLPTRLRNNSSTILLIWWSGSARKMVKLLVVLCHCNWVDCMCSHPFIWAGTKHDSTA